MTLKIEQLDEVALLPNWIVCLTWVTIEAEVASDGTVVEITCHRTAPHEPIKLWGYEPDHFKRGLFMALREAIERHCADEIAELPAVATQRAIDAARDLARRSAMEAA